MTDNLKHYTITEEVFNTLTHAIGALFAIYAIVMLAITSRTTLEGASTAIFGASLFILFQSSACYHVIVSEKAKMICRKIDHSAIYILIAGTYTPLLLLGLPFPMSVVILAMVWYIAFTGIVFSCITLKFKKLSLGLYLGLSWLSIFLVYQLWHSTSPAVIWYFLGGGIVYTVGTIFYASKRKFMHSIWHLFVLGGAVLHYLSIMELLKLH